MSIFCTVMFKRTRNRASENICAIKLKSSIIKVAFNFWGCKGFDRVVEVGIAGRGCALAS